MGPPPSLREFLDAGSDLVESGVWLDKLAELVFLDLPFLPPGERQQQAQESKWRTELLLREDHGPEVGMWWGRVLFWHWCGEVCEDEALAERVRQTLPAEISAPYRALVDCHRQPYPLVLRVPDTWWSCGNCGKAFDEGQEEALVISGREGHSELQETITYCFDCLELLGEVVGEGPQKP